MTVDLTGEEALVLLDLLHAYDESTDERWDLSAMLETQLVAPFKKDYSQILAAARERVGAQGGSW